MKMSTVSCVNHVFPLCGFLQNVESMAGRNGRLVVVVEPIRMTMFDEYWVSQGNKWCDYCKIYVANNPTSVRTHELGTRHKENVAKKLSVIRKDNAAKEREKESALKDLRRIEAQAKKSYERDLAAIRRLDAAAEVRETVAEEIEYKSSLPSRTSMSANSLASSVPPESKNVSSGNGEWTTQEAALEASQAGIAQEQTIQLNRVSSENSQAQTKSEKQAPQITRDLSFKSKPEVGKISKAHSGSVVVKSHGCSNLGKGVASSLVVGKRKRVEKAGPTSTQGTAALEAREAARKRTQEREKSLLGLYHAY